MNPRGKHFIDAVDPDENQVSHPEQQVQDEAEPVEPQWDAEAAPATKSDEKTHDDAEAPSEAPAKDTDDVTEPADEV